MLKVLCDFIHLTAVKYYDELLREVQIGHNIRENVLLKIQKNLKRYERRENAVCAH